jgi:uncharacterized membrane protein YfcA
LTIGVFVLAALVMGVGAAVQGAVGFGAALMAAPVLALLDPTFVPAPLILAALVLNLLVMRRDPGAHHWAPVKWPVIGQVPGALIGVAVLSAAASDDTLGVLFGVLILFAIALSLSGLHPRPTRPVLFGAGTLSGFMQSTVGAGGPPIALVFQNESGPVIRASLSRYFLSSCTVSLFFLTLAGQVGGAELVAAVVLLPGTVLGFLASGWVAHHVDGDVARRAVLTLSAVAAVAVLLKALL